MSLARTWLRQTIPIFHRGIAVVVTLLVGLAAVAAVAGLVDATMRSDGTGTASAALALAWVTTTLGYRRAGRPGLAAATTLVALTQAGSSAWFAAAPIAIAAFLLLGLALPELRLGTPVRRVTAAAVTVGALAWTGWLAATEQAPSTGALAAATVGAGGLDWSPWPCVAIEPRSSSARFSSG